MRTASLMLAVLLAGGTVAALTSCIPLEQANEYIFGRATSPTPGQPPQPAPPILELAASALAVLGYGGLATWIHKAGKNGRRRSTDLESRLTDIIERLAALEISADSARHEGT